MMIPFKVYQANNLEGYRRLTYLMIDADIVYVSLSTTCRVLSAAGLFRRQEAGKRKQKGHRL